MYWFISVLWCVVGTLSFWIILSFKWSKIDVLYAKSLPTLTKFHPVPGHPRYMDLKFSLLRHALFFLVSSVIVYFVKLDIFLSIVTLLNLLYAVLTIYKYRYRKKYLLGIQKDEDHLALAQIMSIPVKDSFCIVIFSVVCYIVLMVLYLIRP